VQDTLCHPRPGPIHFPAPGAFPKYYLQARYGRSSHRRSQAGAAARFADVKLSVDIMLESNQVLTGDEIEAIFGQQLEAKCNCLWRLQPEAQ